MKKNKDGMVRGLMDAFEIPLSTSEKAAVMFFRVDGKTDVPDGYGGITKKNRKIVRCSIGTNSMSVQAQCLCNPKDKFNEREAVRISLKRAVLGMAASPGKLSQDDYSTIMQLGLKRQVRKKFRLSAAALKSLDAQMQAKEAYGCCL